MTLGKAKAWKYTPVTTSDATAGVIPAEKRLSISERSHVLPFSKFTRTAALIAALFFAAVTLLAIGYVVGLDSHIAAPQPSPSSNCTQPDVRKEWRSLSDAEKKDYLDAFQCFIDSPSRLGMNGSLYDDFSWVHNLVAHGTHGKAPFLSWHRRFISVYEKELRTTCKYKGFLPFWDWSLDWEDLPNSPIFDSELGFGGDGDEHAPKFHHAHCVTSTPFKNLQPSWSASEYAPHCLTRWFDDEWLGHYISPDSLAEIIREETYEKFFMALEMKAHDIIPTGIRGDFSAFTAPNDPIFYLHHAQLDRIWWLWQSRNKSERVLDYGGIGEGNRNVTLADRLPLAGLDRDVAVAEVMDTEGGELCYRYMYT